jgi:integrase/recombinase XerD
MGTNYDIIILWRDIMGNLNDFKEFLIEKERSDQTIDAYLGDITQFYKYLKDSNITEIHNNTLKNYKEYLLYELFQATTTVNRKLVSIHQYLAFNEISATTNIVKVQNQNFLENVLSKQEIKDMVEMARSKKDLRAVALMRTLELTGMRISEALQLTIKDIHKDAVQIVGKGNKIRTVFIPKKLNSIWLDYCRNGRVNKGSDYLFVGKRGAITRKTGDIIFKKYASLCNIDKSKAHCHGARHLYCKTLGERPDITIDVIADLAGHQDISVTRRYLRKSKEELLSVIEDLD